MSVQPIAQPIGHPVATAAAAPEPFPYTYSTGNAYITFAWRRNTETQRKVLGQWEVIDVSAPTAAGPDNLTPDETRARAAWRLRAARAARAYAEIALRVEDDFEDVIRTIDDPHDAWVMLE